MVLGRYEEDETADTSKTWYWRCQNWFSPLLFPWCWCAVKKLLTHPVMLVEYEVICNYAFLVTWFVATLVICAYEYNKWGIAWCTGFCLFSWLKKYLYIRRPWLYISFYHLVAVLVFMYSDIVFFSVKCMLKFWCGNNLLKYQVAWWCGGLDIGLAVERLYFQLPVEALLCKLSQPSMCLCHRAV